MSEEQVDLTQFPSAAPLPPPITVSSRSLRPRRQRKSTASHTGSSRSRSLSLAITPQTSYPHDAEPPTNQAQSQPNPSDGRTERLAETLVNDGSTKGKQKAGGKRSYSPSPARSPRRQRRRRADTVGTTTEAGSSPGVYTSASLACERSPPASHLVADDAVASAKPRIISEEPTDAYSRMMDEIVSGSSSAHDSILGALADANPSGTQTTDLDGNSPIHATIISLASGSTLPPDSLADIAAPLPSSGGSTQAGSSGAAPALADAQPTRPRAEVPIQEVEPLAAYTCPICFSPPSYATITPCGHVLCGECLFTAVKTTIQRGAYTLPAGERMVARCPVCRAPIPGWDGKGGGVIGLRPRAVFSL